MADLIDYLRRGHGHAVDHPVHRVDHRGAGVCFRGAGVCPHQADRRLQGGPLCPVGGRPPRRTPGPWPAWTASTRRPSSGRDRADLPDRGHVRLRGTPGPPSAAQGRPPGDRHQRRRAGRDDHRPPAQLQRNAGQALRGHDGQAQRLSARLLVARQPRGHSRRRPAGALCQGRGDRLAGPGGGRGAGDPDAAVDDRSDGLRRALVQGVRQEPEAGAGGLDGRADAWPRGRGSSNQAGIPTYDTPEKAVRAFMHLVSYARNLDFLHETPREIPLAFELDRQRVAASCSTRSSAKSNDILSEDVSKTLAGRLRDSR